MREAITGDDGVQYNLAYADELQRRFWALFIGSKVERDGQITGSKDFLDRMTQQARSEADRYCHWTWRKIQRAGRDADECIAAGVLALKEALRLYRPPQDPPPPTRGEVAKMVATTVAGLGVTPVHRVQDLEQTGWES